MNRKNAITLVLASLLTAALPNNAWGQELSSDDDPRPVVGLTPTLSSASYAVGEKIAVSLSVTNTHDAPIGIVNPSWTAAIYQVVNDTSQVIMSEYGTNQLFAKEIVLGPGETMTLLGDQRLSVTTLENETASPGLYVYRAELIGMGIRGSGAAVFTIGMDPLVPGVGAPFTGDELPAIAPLGRVEPAATGGSAGYGAFVARWYSMPVTWYYNFAGEPSSMSGGNGAAAINAAMDTWENDPAAYDDWTYGGTVTNSAGNHNDGLNIHGWVTSFTGSQAIAQVNRRTSGTQMLEADTEYNSSYSWAIGAVPGAYDMQSIATHEGGHSRGNLADLYNPGQSGYVAWMGSGNPF